MAPAASRHTLGTPLSANATSRFTTAAPIDIPPTVTAFSPANGSTNIATNAGITITFSEPLAAATVSSGTITLRNAQNQAVAATVAYNSATNTATVTPTAALANSATYTVTVAGGAGGVTDTTGNPLPANATSSFTTVGVATTASLFTASTTPTTVDSGDKNAVELGVKFTSSTSGYITGVRFYKASTNTGTHTGSLWSASGQLLATATFTGEGASGWQQVNFATPVAITAGTTYVASYHTTVGHYSVSRSYFASTYTSGPLSVSVNGGVYLYGAGGFPTSSFQASNYFVDVVFSFDFASGRSADSDCRQSRQRLGKRLYDDTDHGDLQRGVERCDGEFQHDSTDQWHHCRAGHGYLQFRD